MKESDVEKLEGVDREYARIFFEEAKGSPKKFMSILLDDLPEKRKNFEERCR